MLSDDQKDLHMISMVLRVLKDSEELEQVGLISAGFRDSVDLVVKEWNLIWAIYLALCSEEE